MTDKRRYVTLVASGYILLNLTIDFWPRYLVFLTPFLILTVVWGEWKGVRVKKEELQLVKESNQWLIQWENNGHD